MPRVYARAEGAEIRVGNWGTVTPDRAALVPPAVAEELAANPDLRIEPDVVPPARRPKIAPAAKEE